MRSFGWLSALADLRGNQLLATINESGLYSAILKSRKAEAKRFKKWAAAEVLPGIRKTGSYNGPAINPMKVLNYPVAMRCLLLGYTEKVPAMVSHDRGDEYRRLNFQAATAPTRTTGVSPRPAPCERRSLFCGTMAAWGAT